MDDDTNPPAKDSKDPRILASVLAIVAAVGLIVAVVTRWWLANPNIGEIRFGPLGAYSCDAFGECASRSNAEFVTWFRETAAGLGHGVDAARFTSSAFAPLGYATVVAAGIGALGLLAAAVLALRRQRPDLPIAPTTVALLGLFVALITGCVFVATKPGPGGMVAAAWGFWTFGITIVVGIAAAQMLAKVLRPMDRDDADDDVVAA